MGALVEKSKVLWVKKPYELSRLGWGGGGGLKHPSPSPCVVPTFILLIGETPVIQESIPTQKKTTTLKKGL